MDTGGMDLAQQTWALTGAAGLIASSLRPGLASRVGRLRLVDLRPVTPERLNEESTVADLRNQQAMHDALEDAHGVIHLGGLADEADFHDLADVNIVGTFHVLEAARRAGTDRVVYASSNRLTGFYDTSSLVDTGMPPRPDGLYGVSKVAGEALGRLYADKFELQVVSVRIGSFEEAPRNERQLSTWLSPRDCLAAFLAAMTAPVASYASFYAVSRNSRRWWDLRAGESLGFDPRDDAESYAPSLQPAGVPAPGRPQGGIYASEAYTLDRQRWYG